MDRKGRSSAPFFLRHRDMVTSLWRGIARVRGDSGRGRDQCGQATKGVWGMSWRQEAMKGVEDCDKPGGAVKQALIPGFPN